MANKLKFSMQTHLTHINIIFEYCHASMSLDNVNVLYLEECMQAGSEKQHRNYFFLKKLFLV